MVYYVQLPWEICDRRTIEKFVSYIAGKVLQIQPKIKNSQKISPAAGSSVDYIQLHWEICDPRTIEKFMLHCWKSAPNTTEDQKFSEILPAAGSLVYNNYINIFRITWENFALKRFFAIIQIRPMIEKSQNIMSNWETFSGIRVSIFCHFCHSVLQNGIK